ncbi:MAG: hypothetical protein DSY55_01970 [Clostridia bacterium]|nr:MAG: hypothetical protein DSY55_01970 [Clostridia bacterium]
MLPWNTDLYLGFGKARPGEFNGSLFAKFQNETLTAIYQPSEQGFIDMTPDYAESIIHFPGPDPTDPAQSGGSQWDWGNTYVYTPTVSSITKHRNLPNVIHTWGEESTAEGLYAAVSSHQGDYKTWTGEVFRSDDLGDSWTRLANKDEGIGVYRTYDIIDFNNALYVIWNDWLNGPCGISRSTDGGYHWTRLSDFSYLTNCRSRLFVYNNQLLALKVSQDGILALNSSGVVTSHAFPGFQVQSWAYNPFAIDGQDRLYMVTEDDRIVRTTDLDTWQTLVASDRDFITLSYWPDQDAIIAGDRGLAGRIWRLNPDASPVTQPPAPVPSMMVAGGDVVINWDPATSLTYRIYRNSQPEFIGPVQYFHESANGNRWTDAGVAQEVGAIYYQVRSQNTPGDISDVTKTLGKFSFAIEPGM